MFSTIETIFNIIGSMNSANRPHVEFAGMFRNDRGKNPIFQNVGSAPAMKIRILHEGKSILGGYELPEFSLGANEKCERLIDETNPIFTKESELMGPMIKEICLEITYESSGLFTRKYTTEVTLKRSNDNYIPKRQEDKSWRSRLEYSLGFKRT